MLSLFSRSDFPGCDSEITRLVTHSLKIDHNLAVNSPPMLPFVNPLMISMRAYLTSLIKRPSFSQRPRQDVVKRIPPVLDLVAAIEQDVFGNAESRQGPIETHRLQAPAPLLTERIGCHHHQIYVRLCARVPACARA